MTEALCRHASADVRLPSVASTAVFKTGHPPGTGDRRSMKFAMKLLIAMPFAYVPPKSLAFQSSFPGVIEGLCCSGSLCLRSADRCRPSLLSIHRCASIRAFRGLPS